MNRIKITSILNDNINKYEVIVLLSPHFIPSFLSVWENLKMYFTEEE